MDLYADLPLAKGAKSSSALDAEGKPKTSLSSTASMWAGAPLMVPQAAKNMKNSNRPTPVVTSSMSMLPSALAAGRGKSPTRLSMSLALKPSSVARKSPKPAQVFSKDEKQEKVQLQSSSTGLGYVAATQVKVISVSQEGQQEKKREEVDVNVNATGGHFFQATYRDEYQPARPNSYEVYCKERKEKKKLEHIKRELSRRQREQEREGKLEREKLAKDLAEGRAPDIKLPTPAGRGRGMTMPAWMRKKIEENAVSQPESERDVDQKGELKRTVIHASPSEGQFEDAVELPSRLELSEKKINSFGLPLLEAPRAMQPSESSNRQSKSSFGVDIGGRQTSERRTMIDEFGREIRHETKRKSEDVPIGQPNKRRTSSRSHDRFDKSGYHSSRENRRRACGWDSRSAHKMAFASRVVLLQNMLGPGEVDDELKEEVRSECSEKYGPVLKCVIYEVTGKVLPEEAVRIFVQFANSEDASKALTGLNGRYFGGRKVKAVYYDESKLERMDFTSQ